MTSSNSFQPNWASPPGETIMDILEEKNISLTEFAQHLGYPAKYVSSLIKGYIPINSLVAKNLSLSLGASEVFWINREAQYRQDATRILENSLSPSDQRWVDEIPISEMTKYGWLEPNLESIADKVRACLRFFGVSNVNSCGITYDEIIETALFRTSLSFDSHPASVAAWLRKGELESELISCSSWDPKKFEETLTYIRSLTRIKNPRLFLPKLVGACAECGVAVTVVRTPSSCRASGATRFVSPDKANILLSFRYLSDEHFWFSFFHEAGHLLLHSKDKLFLEGTDFDDNKEEKEANEFSANILIPNEHRSEFQKLRGTSREIIRFAMRIGIAPGIIVGQLQHLERLPRNRLNSLKRRYAWKND